MNAAFAIIVILFSDLRAISGTQSLQSFASAAAPETESHCVLSPSKATCPSRSQFLEVEVPDRSPQPCHRRATHGRNGRVRHAFPLRAGEAAAQSPAQDRRGSRCRDTHT